MVYRKYYTCFGSDWTSPSDFAECTAASENSEHVIFHCPRFADESFIMWMLPFSTSNHSIPLLNDLPFLKRESAGSETVRKTPNVKVIVFVLAQCAYDRPPCQAWSRADCILLEVGPPSFTINQLYAEIPAAALLFIGGSPSIFQSNVNPFYSFV